MITVFSVLGFHLEVKIKALPGRVEGGNEVIRGYRPNEEGLFTGEVMDTDGNIVFFPVQDEIFKSIITEMGGALGQGLL